MYDSSQYKNQSGTVNADASYCTGLFTFSLMTAWEPIQIIRPPITHCFQNRKDTFPKLGQRINRLRRFLQYDLSCYHTTLL